MRSEEPKGGSRKKCRPSTIDYRLSTSDRSLKEALHSWYLKKGRHNLPWRETKNPYKIYLSEIMLQQTQVTTVLERFYSPFLERFPTLKSVAEASEEEVLKAWEGLGYYSRARNLYRTARITGGVLPGTAEELEALPGIGRSTARAIACFAFGEAQPILDANVRRILFRFFRRRRATEKELWRMAERLFDAERAFAWNQGMMDLGATVCLPEAPRCGECPLAEGCRGKMTPERYPAPKTKKEKPVRKRRILVAEAGGRYALLRSAKRFHGGLWHFPQCEEDLHGEILGRVKQHYSHFTLDGKVLLVSRLPASTEGELHWFSPEEMEELPMGGADRKVLEMIVSSEE